MGRLIYTMNVSLDGFIETPDRSLDWSVVDDELHTWFNDHSRGLAASLYGRRLWEVMAAYWPTSDDDPAANDVMREYGRIWRRVPKVVFSKSLEQVEHGARLVHGDVGAVLDQLRHEYDGDLEVGGPNLAAQFIRRGLVTDFKLLVHPVVLGSGTPFWPELEAPMRLRLVETRTFASGVILLAYAAA